MDGWPDRVRERGDRVTRYLRGAPATLVYTFTLLVTWWTTTGIGRESVHRLLVAQSTNVRNMLDDPFRVLVASAFWIDSPVFPVLTTTALLAVMVPAERALGTRRWVAVFAAGHVGASVLTATGIAVAIDHGLLPDRVSTATDVGVSYGFVAVAGAALWLLPRRWARVLALAVLVAGLGTAAVVSPTFTAYGHLTALAIGLALWPAVRAWLARTAAHSAARSRAVTASAQVGVEEPQDAGPGVLGGGLVVAEPRQPHQ